MIKKYAFIVSLLVLTFLVGLSAAGKKAGSPPMMAPAPAPAPEPQASIHVRGKPKTSVLVTLAKISYQEAMADALRAVPGQVASGELDADDGTLQYDFEIVTSAGKVMDVSIDAGDGKVLEVDQGDDN